ncbi:MAG: RidA family protein [Candidatus Binatia bacterium]
MTIEEKIAKLGLTLPPPHEYPSPNRTGCVRVGNLLFASGHPPAKLPGIKTRGKVGGDVSEEEGYQAARAAALNILSSVKKHVGELDRVKRVVKLLGMVNTAPGFERQFAVIDGASDLFFELWGLEYGQHARAAVGMFELPRQNPVEIEAIFELQP